MKTTFKILALAAALALAHRAPCADEGFVPLFNGKDTAGWKLRNPNGKSFWTVEDGILKNTSLIGRLEWRMERQY